MERYLQLSDRDDLVARYGLDKLKVKLQPFEMPRTTFAWIRVPGNGNRPDKYRQCLKRRDCDSRKWLIR